MLYWTQKQGLLSGIILTKNQYCFCAFIAKPIQAQPDLRRIFSDSGGTSGSAFLR
jgi:hypothetical protein